jgi:hypothetical protein
VTDIDDLRPRLLDGVPPLVRGMAEAIVAEWERAVDAVPQLERLAVEDLVGLAALPAQAREQELRRRWDRMHEVPVAELPGVLVLPAPAGRVAAAR